jgi:hypothetical protein
MSKKLDEWKQKRAEAKKAAEGLQEELLAEVCDHIKALNDLLPENAERYSLRKGLPGVDLDTHKVT